VANSANITFSHNTFTGMSLVQTQRAHANILFDSNRLDGNNAGPNDYEGRLTIRGYDNTQPVGVTITNNHFGGGGCSDGIQVVGDAYGVRIGPGNKFTGLRQGSCGAHVDPIQFYGATATVVTGNYFDDNGDGSGGIMSPDGDDGYTVTNNVFAETGVYPFAVAMGGCARCIITHNLFVNAGLAVGTSNGGTPSTGVIARDNVFKNGGISPGPGSTYSATYNLNAGVRGTGNIKGRAIFVGGAKPKTYAGYRLAAGSRGKGAASDGTDMGIRRRR
jgi:hypothetical protein